MGDNADQCDATPTAEIGDINTDGCGASERDTDGDGVNDNLDAFPNDPLKPLTRMGMTTVTTRKLRPAPIPTTPTTSRRGRGLPIWLLYEATQP